MITKPDWKSLLQKAYEAHDLTIQDKIHLALYAPEGLFPPLTDFADAQDPNSLDKLALLGLKQLDASIAFTSFDEIDKDCNLEEILRNFLDAHNLTYTSH